MPIYIVKSILVIALAIIAFVTLASFVGEQYYTLKFSVAVFNRHFQKLSAIKQLATSSNLPHQDVMFIANSIDSLQSDIIGQVKTQMTPPEKNRK